MKKALSLFLAIVMVALMIPFAAFVTSANGETSTGITETDFTTIATDDGVDGDINPSLPEGFVVSNDTASGQISAAVLENGTKNGYTSINYTAGNNGVLLGGALQTLAMNSKAPGVTDAMRKGTEDYVIEFTWDTSHKYSQLLFAWTETEPTYENGTATLATPQSDFIRIIVQCGAGNTSGAGTFVTTTAYYSGTDIKNLSTWGDIDGTAHGSKVDPLRNLVNNEIPLTYSLVVKAGVLEEIHLSYNGVIVETYYNNESGASDLPAIGYFTLWNDGWGGNNSVNINSIRVKALAEGETVTEPLNASKYFAKTGNVVHYADLSNKETADAVPYDTKGDVNYRDNALWVEDSDVGLINIDKELFGGLSSYTLELTYAPGSAARILFVCFKGTGDADSDFGNDTSSNAEVLNLRCSSAGYGLDNTNVAGTLATSMPTEFGERMNAEGFKVRCVVINGTLNCTVVTIADDSDSLTLVPDRKMTSVVAGSIVISQATTGGVDDQMGLQAVKIIDAPVYGAELPEADAEILAPAGKAVVKEGTNATVVDAGTVYSDLIAYKENGALTGGATFTAESGNVYAALVSKNDVVLTAGAPELRLGSNPGIRYTTGFEGEDLSFIMSLTNLDTTYLAKVEMGTLVTVDTYLAGAGEFTADALKAYGESISKNIYMNITADAANLYAENTFAGSVIGVKDFTRNYVARAYVTLTFSDASTVTIYSDATEAISVKALAQAIVDAEYAGYTTDAEKAALDYLAAYTAA